MLKRIHLLPRLVASYVALGVVATLLSLAGGRYTQRSAAEKTAYRTELLRRTRELRAVGSSASEEGFSFVLVGDEGEHRQALANLDDAVARARQLPLDARLTTEERRGLAGVVAASEKLRTAAGTMFDVYARTRSVPPEPYRAYDVAIDDLVDGLDAVCTVVGAQSSRDQEAARRDADLLTLVVGLVAALVAIGVGIVFGRRITATATQHIEALQLAEQRATTTNVKLAAAEHRYRALVENARDAIAIVTPEGSILEVNRGWEQMLGIPREQIVGRNVHEFAPQGDEAARHSEFVDAVAQGGGSNPSTLFRRADGSLVNVEISRTVVEVGGARYVLSVGRDMTERLRLEDQFRQAQKMEAIGRLAGGVAHDFNNLLCVILSCSEVLLDELGADDETRGDVEAIREAGSRAAGLTRQLLMFSRQQVVAPKVLDLNEVLTGMDRMLQRIVGEDVSLVLAPAPRLGSVRTDPGSIEQVIMNLVVNARDAMPTGGKLTIETANVTVDEVDAGGIGVTGPHVVLMVSDTGVGMDRATKARIFEPFFTTKGPGKGTGLGLSTVFGIVQQSGGRVVANSEPGRGTTFNVYLPIVDAAVDAAPQTSHVEAGGSETILVVEDEDQVRAVAVGILRRSGYHVIEARGSGEALLACETHRDTIDLLLTDVVMPQMSGPELAKRLAEIRPKMKVLCMSGYMDDSNVRHGVETSELAYLQKPFTPPNLRTKVREVLDAARASSAPPSSRRSRWGGRSEMGVRKTA